MEKKLNCFYDLASSPCSYDFFYFLTSAELYRVQRGFKELEVTFVSGPCFGYREDSLRTFEQNDMFFKNVIFPGAHLLESCKSIKWVNNLDELRVDQIDATQIFPRGYSVENRINTDYVGRGIISHFLMRRKPIRFTAPNYAKNIASQYMEQFKGKKVITLTARELKREDGGTRKINHAAWKEFFKNLNRKEYQPLVIRDTSYAFGREPLFEDVPELPTASIHLHTRMAIYEKSYVNFFKNNGVVVPAFHSSANCAWFNEFDESIPVLSRRWFGSNYGMIENSPVPMTTNNKIFVSASDSTSNIDIVFAKLNKIIEDGKSELLNEFISLNHVARSVSASLMQTCVNLKHGVFSEDTRLLKFMYNLIDKKVISFELQPFDLILDFEKNLKLPKGTALKICELDKTMRAYLPSGTPKKNRINSARAS